MVITTSIPLEDLEERISYSAYDPRLEKIFLLRRKLLPFPCINWGSGFELQKEMTSRPLITGGLTCPGAAAEPGCAYNLALQYAESPDGWLVSRVLMAAVKPHTGAAIVNYRFSIKKPAVFVVVPEFLDHLRKTFSPESKVSYDQLFEGVKTAPLLVLDDFGEQSTTPWAQEKLYQVINYRYNARLATVITTTCSFDEIEPRVASRMVDPKISDGHQYYCPGLSR